MAEVFATNGKLLYRVCRQALRAENMKYRVGDSKAIVMWCDALWVDYFDKMKPWQVINRLPWGRAMCRKAPFVRLLHRISPYFPDYFNFLPKSYILPLNKAEFMEALGRKDKRYIYKPDKGSLGQGIRVIEPGEPFDCRERLAVAQEYIDSYTIDDRKFDLRLYALITSVQPLQIYIYRNGVARFCTASAEGNGKFSFLTNTAVNQKNPDADPEQMTQLVSEVFETLRAQGHDIDSLWERIHSAIVLTIISAYGFLKQAEDQQCPNVGYPRCFQIIGCDVLLDRQLNPYILEVNYRPSLKCPNARAHDLKLDMIQDSIRLACPYKPLQDLILETPDVPETIDEYRAFVHRHRDVVKECERRKRANEADSQFVKVFPNPAKPVWNMILEVVESLPTDVTPDDSLPTELEPPERPVTIPRKRTGSRVVKVRKITKKQRKTAM